MVRILGFFSLDFFTMKLRLFGFKLAKYAYAHKTGPLSFSRYIKF